MAELNRIKVVLVVQANGWRPSCLKVYAQLASGAQILHSQICTPLTKLQNCSM